MKNIFKSKPKIVKGHSLSEYLIKYSNDYVNCKLEEVSDPKKLKPHKTYWKINNKYYQINHKNIFKWIFVGLGCAGIVTSVALPVTYHFLNKERYQDYNFKYWNECESLNKLKTFVANTVDPSKSTYVPKEYRIATFDMDGTLYGERAPTYIEWLMYHDYLSVSQKGSYKIKLDETVVAVDGVKLEEDQQFKYTRTDIDLNKVDENIQYIMKNREDPPNEDIEVELTPGTKTKYTIKVDMEMREALAGAINFSSIKVDDYINYVNEFLKKEPTEYFSNLKYQDMLYKPMIELVEFLRLNNFDVYVVSGTDRFMVREIVKKHLSVPENKIIGMDVNLNVNEKGEIYRGDTLMYKNVKKVKVELVKQEIGITPILSFGNSTGDVDLSNYTLNNPNYKGAVFMVNNDDNEREYIQDRSSTWAKYPEYTVFSMKNDFKTIYGDNVKKTGI